MLLLNKSLLLKQELSCETVPNVVREFYDVSTNAHNSGGTPAEGQYNLFKISLRGLQLSLAF